jgi:uncharacterized phage protein (TIGR01671 family)
MREIKFRVWDKKNNKMLFYDTDVVPNLTLNGVLVRNLNGIDDNVSADYELMQFTGLKDKNGKGIYEGDIVHLEKREWDEYWTVEYDESSAKFVVYNQLNSTREFESEFGEVWVEVTEDKRWQPEVIGNIWENKSLLQGETE